MEKVKLLAEWIFDQLIYPIWTALFPPKEQNDGESNSGSSRSDV